MTAEAQGFEPWKGLSPLNALAVRSLRPLGHASSGPLLGPTPLEPQWPLRMTWPAGMIVTFASIAGAVAAAATMPHDGIPAALGRVLTRGPGPDLNHLA
jgi:hypothetical protein